MEDILASIRKILDEDDAGKATGGTTAEPHPAPAPPHREAPADDVLMLDESMMVPDDFLAMQSFPALQAPAETASAGMALPAPEPTSQEPVPQEPVPQGSVPQGSVPPGPAAPELVPPAPAASEPAPPVPMPPPAITTPLATPLVSPAAAGAASGSVEMLMRTLARERTTATHRGGPTIEDLVREEMRPLLREWLDTHLPPLVERLVRTEIERVVNRMSS